MHNLKNLDVDLPRDQLVVLTGVSGSGKSTLAFDTIYAEGQRRFLECLSSYARQFLDQLERPDVDSIEGLPPTVAIDQRTGSANPRSTLGTVTEIQDYLRILFARLGVPHCPHCGTAIRNQTPEQMTAQLLALPEGKRIQILAPLVRWRKGQHLDVFQAIRRAGLIRARVDGELVEIGDDPPKLSKTKQHSIEAVIDRIAIREGIRPRLAESLDLALKLSAGMVLVLIETVDKTWDERLLSTSLNCPDCGRGVPEIEPRSFSFNSPHGACADCGGLGSRRMFQQDLVIPDATVSWNDGAVVPLSLIVSHAKASTDGLARLDSFLDRHHVNRADPLEGWPAKVRESFWSGEPSGFAGLVAFLDQTVENAKSDGLAKALDVYRQEVPCPACGGSRLRPEARSVRFEGQTIAEIGAMAVSSLLERATGITFEPAQAAVGNPLLTEIVGRLRYLDDVGLGYLSLGRGTDTLSGGELQRARLAAQLGSGLVGVCYILDEPTAGLHPSDTERLLGGLKRLLELGNSIVVVEHDESIIRGADWVVDLGPGAGPDGGAIVAFGPPQELGRFEPASATAVYLNRPPIIPSPSNNGRLDRSPGWIEIQNGSTHNLKNVTARIPLAAFTCISGVSGSGKSSLVHDLLATTVRRYLHARQFRRDEPEPLVHASRGATISGLNLIEQLIEVDQSPIGRTPRSTPATVTGLFDEIRRVFALTREAKVRGFGAARFSFNARGGRCEVCQGLGRRRIPMHYLPDLHITCEECGGTRYNRPTLEVRFKGKSIGDVLQMRVDESRSLFDAIPRVLRGLKALHDVGLGYVTLGQSSTTLSGGEAQRVKLASELGKNAASRVLYILDEPTTGLHFADIERLLAILHQLVDLGHSVVVIEHNLDVIASADWVIDLGSGGGADGGTIVAMGPPDAIAAAPLSRTGEALCGRGFRGGSL